MLADNRRVLDFHPLFTGDHLDHGWRLQRGNEGDFFSRMLLLMLVSMAGRSTGALLFNHTLRSHRDEVYRRFSLLP